MWRAARSPSKRSTPTVGIALVEPSWKPIEKSRSSAAAQNGSYIGSLIILLPWYGFGRKKPPRMPSVFARDSASPRSRDRPTASAASRRRTADRGRACSNRRASGCRRGTSRRRAPGSSTAPANRPRLGYRNAASIPSSIHVEDAGVRIEPALLALRAYFRLSGLTTPCRTPTEPRLPMPRGLPSSLPSTMSRSLPFVVDDEPRPAFAELRDRCICPTDRAARECGRRRRRRCRRDP